MFNIVKDSIEYSGLTDSLPVLPPKASFKQFNIQKILKIPTVKPDIDQIVKVMTDVVIINTKVIRTPVLTSVEGQKLTGFKLIVEGEANQNIEYIADEPSQSVHTILFKIPFNTSIILPSNFAIGTPLNVTSYIENISTQLLDKRTIFKSITTLIVLIDN